MEQKTLEEINKSYFIQDKNKLTISFSKDEFIGSNDKTIFLTYLVRAYIRFRMSPTGLVGCTLNSITENCGYSIKGNSKENNNRVRKVLLEMISSSFIVASCDIATIKNTEYFEIQVVNEHNMFYCESNFVTLSMYEFQKITSSVVKSKTDILLATYLCIKKGIYNSSFDIPRMSIISQEKIKDLIGVKTIKTVKAAINDLEKLELLFCSSSTYVYYDKRSKDYRKVVTVYAIDKRELSRVKEFIQNQYDTDEVYLFYEINGNTNKSDGIGISNQTN